MTKTDEPLPSGQCVESEQEKDDQQLKQASDTVAVQPDELIQAADRERQLQMQLDKAKDDIIRLQMQVEHRCKKFEDFKQRSAPLWEQAMKQRDSKPCVSFATPIQFTCCSKILVCRLSC